MLPFCIGEKKRFYTQLNESGREQKTINHFFSHINSMQPTRFSHKNTLIQTLNREKKRKIQPWMSESNSREKTIRMTLVHESEE